MPRTETIKKEWEDFKRLCYPAGMPGELETRLYRAFMAGSISTAKLYLIVSENQDEEAAHADLLKLNEEIIEACRVIAEESE